VDQKRETRNARGGEKRDKRGSFFFKGEEFLFNLIKTVTDKTGR